MSHADKIELALANRIKNSEPEAFNADQEWAAIKPAVNRFNFTSWQISTFNIYYLGGILAMTALLLITFRNVKTEPGVSGKNPERPIHKEIISPPIENVPEEKLVTTKTYEQKLPSKSSAVIVTIDSVNPRTEATAPEATPQAALVPVEEEKEEEKEEDNRDFYQKYSAQQKDSSGEKLFIPGK